MTVTVFVSESIEALLSRPIKRRLRARRWLSKFDRRLDAAYKKRESGWRGSHERWWELGRQAIQSEGMSFDEECPF